MRRTGGWGEHVPPRKNSRRPQQSKKIVLGGMPKRLPPSDKYRKMLNVFYTCSLWARTAAILSSISCGHYGFPRKLIKNKLFSAPITEQFVFHQHCNTSVAVFISVSKSTKNMLKQRFPNLCYSFRGSASDPAGVVYCSPPQVPCFIYKHCAMPPPPPF